MEVNGATETSTEERKSRMKIALATLADAANISQEGKLNVMGVFQTITMENTPAVFAKMVLAVIVEAETEDLGNTIQIGRAHV